MTDDLPRTERARLIRQAVGQLSQARRQNRDWFKHLSKESPADIQDLLWHVEDNREILAPPIVRTVDLITHLVVDLMGMDLSTAIQRGLFGSWLPDEARRLAEELRTTGELIELQAVPEEWADAWSKAKHGGPLDDAD